MSFGGLPPLVGFFPKWIVIRLSIESGQFGLLSVIIFIRLFSLFYYVRVIYAVLAQSNVFNKLFNYKEYNESFILVFYILILSGLLFIPLLVLII
jgi:NADH:ubiquinone oxidoreductase subunit 2 (subunit N)